MAPSDETLSNTIRSAVRRMFQGPDRDNLTVNQVREYVESELGLEEGFLKGGLWKQESKNIVKTEIDKLIRLEDVGEELPPVQSTLEQAKAATPKKLNPEPIKKGVKRSSNEEIAKEQKRQRKNAVAVSVDEEDDDSALTSIGDTPEESEDNFLSDTPEPKKPKKRAVDPNVIGGRNHKLDKEEDIRRGEADIDKKLHISPSKPIKKTSAGKNVQGDGSDALAKNSVSDGMSKENSFMDVHEADMLSDSEMSVVLDEAPKRKTKSQSAIKGQSSNRISRSSKPPKASKHTTELSPDEAELKTLQSQLTMCGVRKIWGVILKDYGSDTKAKIRHLKGMLKDIGMEGRFSKQKAQEIKEARELQEDLEAVKEGNAKWGMGRGARSKKIRKSFIEQSDEEEEEDIVDRESPSEHLPARVAKAKMDLAFLGDESESDD